MKLKFLSSLALFVSLGLIYITMSSDSGGKFNGGTSCSSCHGNANTATSVALTGLPTTFIAGTTYTLNFKVTNQTLSKAGFNILCSSGQFTSGTGSQTNGPKTQITHITPMLTSTSTAPFVETFVFSWTAPATTAAVTFSAVGNAVNGDNNDSNADQWNGATYTVSGSFPTSVNAEIMNQMNCYPNPTSGQLTIEGLSNNTNIQIFNIFGQKQMVTYELTGNKYLVNTSWLAKGTYIIQATHADGKVTGTFTKN